jgi:biopolymer transport protein ExbB/TolQ
LSVKDVIHTISSVLEVPVIIILILAMVVVVFQLGGLIVEFFVERMKGKPNVPQILDEIAGKKEHAILNVLHSHPLQRSQKKAFERLLLKAESAAGDHRLLAAQLLAEEESRLERRVSVTDIIARIGPMFGLMATLIPLGPGLIALGEGEPQGLSDSLMTAFDATVAGLAAAGVAYIISKVRKRWYQADLMVMETLLEGVVR